MSLPQMFNNIANLPHPHHRQKQPVIKKMHSQQEKRLHQNRFGSQKKEPNLKVGTVNHIHSIQKIIQTNNQKETAKSSMLIHPQLVGQYEEQEKSQNIGSSMHLKQKIKMLTNNHRIIDIFDQITFRYNEVVQRFKQQSSQQQEQSQFQSIKLKQEHPLQNQRQPEKRQQHQEQGETRRSRHKKKNQDYIKYLKLGFIEQRNKATLMEGQYEMRIEELQQKLNYTKMELRKLYEDYAIANSERIVCLQSIQDLKQENVLIRKKLQLQIDNLKDTVKNREIQISQLKNQRYKQNEKKQYNAKQVLYKQKKIVKCLPKMKIQIEQKPKVAKGKKEILKLGLSKNHYNGVQTHECGFNAKPQSFEVAVDNGVQTHECGFNAKPQSFEVAVDNGVQTHECGFNAKPQSFEVAVDNGVQTHECGFNAKPQSFEVAVDNGVQTHECGFNAKPQSFEVAVDNGVQTHECGFNAKPQTIQFGIATNNQFSTHQLLSAFSFTASSPFFKQIQTFSFSELICLDNFRSIEQLFECSIVSQQIFFKQEATQLDFNWKLTEFIYIIQANKNRQSQKFVFFNAQLIHIGSSVEQMKLSSISTSFSSFDGASVALGNGQVTIRNNKLKIKRVDRRRIFSGSMENGEWEIIKVWSAKL